MLTHLDVGPSWGYVGPFCRHVGPFWPIFKGMLAQSRGHVGPSWGPCFMNVGPFGRYVAPSCAALGTYVGPC